MHRPARVLRPARVALLALIAVCVGHDALGIGAGEVADAVAGAAGTGAFAVASAIAFAQAASRRTGRGAALGIGIGLGLWTPGYLFYIFEWNPLRTAVPPADMLWIAGYLGFYLAIIALARARIERAGAVWLDGLAGGLAMAAAAVALIVPLVRGWATGSMTATAVALAYPLADALLLAFTVMLAAMTGWRPGRAFTAMAAAMAALVLVDLPYFVGIADGTSHPGSAVDVGWMAAAAAMAVATWQAPPSAAAKGAPRTVALSFVAFSANLSVGVLAYGAIAHVALGAVLLAILAAGIALLRGLVSYRELHELFESRRLSLTDDLTGLGNRRRLMRELHEVLPERPAAVLLLDLDGFKELNDALGHHAGDRVLCAVADRLAGGLRERDDLAVRLGGDEFAVLLRDGDRSRALAVGERLATAIAAPIVVDGVTLRVHASIGAVVAPQDGSDADLLLQHADTAMYRAKVRPEAVVAYTEDLAEDALDRLRLAGELERALDQRELVLHYQPITDTRTGAISSVEALVRWQHPERGLLGPGAFLPALERTTLTRRFSRVVLEDAVAQSVAFRNAGRRLRVAVNLMPADVLDSNLPAEVARLLVVHGAHPADLVLEVTESGVLSDFDRAHDVVQGLRALGVHVALDDFGTGHSSLTHLQRLPVDILKIDRSFVAEVGDKPTTAAIVRSMVELAHTLGQAVVAEGVEEIDMWRRVAGWGCDYVQGWMIGPAVPAGELLASLPELDARGRRAAGRPPLHVVA